MTKSGSSGFRCSSFSGFRGISTSAASRKSRVLSAELPEKKGKPPVSPRSARTKVSRSSAARSRSRYQQPRARGARGRLLRTRIPEPASSTAMTRTTGITPLRPQMAARKPRGNLRRSTSRDSCVISGTEERVSEGSRGMQAEKSASVSGVTAPMVVNIGVIKADKTIKMTKTPAMAPQNAKVEAFSARLRSPCPREREIKLLAPMPNKFPTIVNVINIGKLNVNAATCEGILVRPTKKVSARL